MIYKKIEIKSEADLPKEEEIYYEVHFKSDNTIQKLKRLITPELNYYWIENIDWYLLPISEEEWLREELQTPIEDGLYATGRFTTDECSVLAEGLLMYINDYLKTRKDEK